MKALIILQESSVSLSLNVKRFEADLSTMCARVSQGRVPQVKIGLDKLIADLVELYRKNLVKINHSLIELQCAGNLIEQGYEIEVERRVSENLVCDVFGKKGDATIIVEIETGFVPPSHALDPATYCYARIISKTARYSAFANRFVLGTTMSNILTIPRIFQEPPRFRKAQEIQKAKAICDIYYNKPKITKEEILYAELHSVFILDVDRGSIRESSPDTYLAETEKLRYPFD